MAHEISKKARERMLGGKNAAHNIRARIKATNTLSNDDLSEESKEIIEERVKMASYKLHSMVL